MYCAPARIAMRAVSVSSTVPAPIRISSEPYCLAKASMTAVASGTVKVTSIAAAPPRAQASAIRAAWSELFVRTIATSPDSMTFPRTFSFSIGIVWAYLCDLFRYAFCLSCGVLQLLKLLGFALRVRSLSLLAVEAGEGKVRLSRHRALLFDREQFGPSLFGGGGVSCERRSLA